MSIKNIKKGFTLVEMMVVLAIFFIITGIVIVNVPSLRNRVSVDLVAQNIAVSVRQAQAFGTAIRQVNGETPRSWGIHFNIDEKNNFLLFAVMPGYERRYIPGSGTFCDIGSYCVEDYLIRGAIINDICVVRGNFPNCDSYSLVDIVYTRPSSEPYFCARNSYDASCIDDISFVRINIVSITEEEGRDLEIYANGQIAVKF